ncbi:MAG: SAM-dependent DNA methyltransferase, partial [Endozoicomonadaceae bacterium]|nr:SAM-dependent DNA methyltransferase [Endozoicomonadaceae bacterium]
MSNTNTTEIVNKVWNYANVLRDDGVGYGDYVEQITFLIFLKMADERETSGQQITVPKEFSWAKLVKCDGEALEIQYRHTLESLGKKSGMLGTIFRKAQNKIQDPAKLERLIQMIEKEAWSTLPVDVKGEIYEGLLERNAQDVKGGAGQYFTPRALIQAIVAVMQPDITKLHTVADPATGTGGFLLAAYDYMA